MSQTTEALRLRALRGLVVDDLADVRHAVQADLNRDAIDHAEQRQLRDARLNDPAVVMIDQQHVAH
ncbi:hypothetical protein sortregn_1 [Escherichia phage sortregn]|nr:hypothetical protein sortregn_1 [Escherichia phage sortregn]